MNDLIYRQQAINAIMGLIEARLGWKSDASKEINGLNAAYCVIEDLPSAEPRMKGRWIKQVDESINAWWYECSVCGDYPLKNAFGHDSLSKFCPWCGSEMSEGDEDDND